MYTFLGIIYRTVGHSHKLQQEVFEKSKWIKSDGGEIPDRWRRTQPALITHIRHGALYKENLQQMVGVQPNLSANE